MQTDTSTRQSHSLIASDRVEGTPVRRSDGGKIGTIERLMIEKGILTREQIDEKVEELEAQQM